MVISPNTTLTLECVPVRMAGVAGGALQTGQRIGTAIGTAVLASVFGMVVGRGYPVALTVALGCAALLTCGALALAVAELRGRRHRASEAQGEVRAAETSAADVQRG